MGAGLSTDGRTTVVLRRALLALAAAGVAMTAIELAMLRHWGTFTRDIPWVVLAITAMAIAVLARRRSRRTVLAARVTAVVVTTSTIYGIVQHVIANHDAGPLDARYGATWQSMSTWAQWWEAATESVGPSPPLAPAALALGGVCLWLATTGHTRTERLWELTPPTPAVSAPAEARGDLQP